MSYQSIHNDYFKSKSSLNNQIAENVEENINILKSQSIALYNYENIAYLLAAADEDLTEEYLENYSLVYGNLVSIIQGNSKLDSISIIDLNGEVKFFYDRYMSPQNLNNASQEEWFPETIKAGGRAVIVPPHEDVFTKVPNEIISVCRGIQDPYNDKIIGIVKINQRSDTLKKLFTNYDLEEDERNILYDQQGNIFYSSTNLSTEQTEDIFMSLKGLTREQVQLDSKDKNHIIIQGESVNQQWKMISLVNKNTIVKKAAFIKNINSILTIILFFVCGGLAIGVSLYINGPIQKLISSIKRFQAGDMNEQVVIHRKDEFGSIAEAFNNMIASIRKLINEEYKMELLKKQAEFENYQSQINPHFLFNTLNSIKAVAIQGDTDRTANMIQYLSDSFRYTLNKGVYLVSFKDEMEHIDKYIYLQKMRFQEKYNVIKDIDEDVLHNEIPRMVLQPIIENAFQHGFENTTQSGEIKITAVNIDGEFIIYIANTGEVISDEQLKLVNTQLAVAGDQYGLENKDKIGIYNVNARIRYHYGEQYGLKFIQSSDHCTMVKIQLPNIKFVSK